MSHRQEQLPSAGRRMHPGLLPPCPSARTRQAWRRASPAGSVRQDAMSFLDEPSSSGNVPGCGRGDSCVPKIQPRSCLPEATKQRQKQSWQGVHGPSQRGDRPLPGLHLPGPQPACKVRPIEVPPAGDDGPSHSSAPSARKHEGICRRQVYAGCFSPMQVTKVSAA